MDLIHTEMIFFKIFIQLIRHEEKSIANLSTATTQSLLAVYIGLGWNVITNLGTN
jgi:hypothetical protein